MRTIYIIHRVKTEWKRNAYRAPGKEFMRDSGFEEVYQEVHGCGPFFFVKIRAVDEHDGLETAGSRSGQLFVVL